MARDLGLKTTRKWSKQLEMFRPKGKYYKETGL